jgi:hypothetical protein
VLDYQILRTQFTAPRPPITVVSDSGPMFATGTPLAGSNPPAWNVVGGHGEGFFLRTKVAEPLAAYVEDSMAHAWNLATTLPANVTQPPLFNPPGSIGPIYPIQSVLTSDLALANGDRFGFIVGDNDWLVPGILNLNGPVFVGLGVPDALPTAKPNVAEAVNDLATSIVASYAPRASMLIVTSTQRPVIQLRQWNEHHGHMSDDVSVWGAAPGGSGLYSYLTTTMGIAP